MTITEDETTTDQLADEASADTVTLPGHRCNVTMADGTLLRVRITNHCYIAWDKTAPRKKWGQAADVPFLAGTFMAWIAAKRQSLTTLSWEDWQEQVEDVENLAEEPEDLVGPTRPGVRPGTS